MSHRPVPLEQMVGQFGAILRARGLWQVYRSSTGSRYFRRPEENRFQLRIADHEWSNWSQLKHVHVIKSVVVTPMPMRELEQFADHVISEFIEACRRRMMVTA